MGNQDYQNEKVRISYELMKNRKLFRKARAIIMKDNKLLAIKVVYKDDRPDHYLFPGGGVDEGETISEAAVREAYEEYGVRVTPIKQLGKQYYSVQMKYNGESFYSKRVEYHYICELDNIDENFWDKFCIENWGDLCVLSEEEVSEITELWNEITM